MGRASGSVCPRWTCLAASAALLLPPFLLLLLSFTPQTRPHYYFSSPYTHHSTSTSNSTSTLEEDGSHGNRSPALRISAMVDPNSTFTSSALLEEDGHLGDSISSITNSARDGAVAAAAQPKIEGKDAMGRREERSFGDVGLKRIERDLAKARCSIRRAVAAGRNRSSEVVQLQGGFVPRGVVYRNPLTFHE